jgi:hypothetical protein
MTYTTAHHAALSSTAADSKRDRDRDGGLAIILTRLQGGACFDCGATGVALEFAHFTRAQGRTSRTMGVLGAMSCRDCNLIHNLICEALDTDGTLPLAYLMSEGRADRIVTEYPTRAECVRVWKDHSAADRLSNEAAARIARM